MGGITPAATPTWVDAFLAALSTGALMLRFLSRKLSDAGFWWDDWLALAAWVRLAAHNPRSLTAQGGPLTNTDRGSSLSHLQYVQPSLQVGPFAPLTAVGIG